jgi:transcriptional regulator with XRE-family HTH domain
MDSFDKISARTPKDTEQFVSRMLDIAERIQEILTIKKMTQKDLAKVMGKSESEISKWLTGLHNLEIRTISKIESVLGVNIIEISKSKNQVEQSSIRKTSNNWSKKATSETYSVA